MKTNDSIHVHIYNNYFYAITAIEEYAFERCNELTAVVLPEGVTMIGEAPFSLCIRLAEFTFPASVMTIGDHAFAGCGLQTIISLSTTPPVLGTATFTGIFDGIPADARLYVRCTAVADYRASAWQLFFADILPFEDKPTALDEAYNERSSTALRKVIRDGNVLIFRRFNMYDATGRRVE